MSDLLPAPALSAADARQRLSLEVRMKIGVIGPGRVGSSLARALASSHDVFLGSRDSARARAIAEETGAGGSGTYGEAVRHGEVVILSVPWWAIDETLAELGELDGRVVIDTVNPYTDGSYTEMVEFIGTSAAEEIQKQKPRSHVVKAWNTIHAQVMDSSPDFDGVPASVFVCGDDAAAKDIVTELATELGYAPVDCGPLSSARYVEPMAGLKVRLSYELELGTEQTINLVER